QHAGLREEPLPGGNHGTRGVPDQAAPGGPGARARRGACCGAPGGRWRGPGAEAVILFALVVLALVYLRGWDRSRAGASERIPPWRAGCFLAGLASIGIASASPLASCDAGSLTVHMAQHL